VPSQRLPPMSCMHLTVGPFDHSCHYRPVRVVDAQSRLHPQSLCRSHQDYARCFLWWTGLLRFTDLQLNHVVDYSWNHSTYSSWKHSADSSISHVDDFSKRHVDDSSLGSVSATTIWLGLCLNDKCLGTYSLYIKQCIICVDCFYSLILCTFKLLI